MTCVLATACADKALVVCILCVSQWMLGCSVPGVYQKKGKCYTVEYTRDRALCVVIYMKDPNWHTCRSLAAHVTIIRE